MNRYTKEMGFTLAEVLITLAIIGIVAALTIPNLVVKYQKRQTVVRLQKAYSEINQALKLAEVEHGFMNTWSWQGMGSSREEIQENFIKNYLGKSIKIAKYCDDSNLTECIKTPIKYLNNTEKALPEYPEAILTASGYSIFVWFGGITEEGEFSEHVHFFIDIDGPNKGESQIGKDVFQISANFNVQQAVSVYENRPKKAGVYFYGNGWIPELTRDELINHNNLGCNKNAYGAFCGALIQRDNWEITEEYPWN